MSVSRQVFLSSLSDCAFRWYFFLSNIFLIAEKHQSISIRNFGEKMANDKLYVFSVMFCVKVFLFRVLKCFSVYSLPSNLKIKECRSELKVVEGLEGRPACWWIFVVVPDGIFPHPIKCFSPLLTNVIDKREYTILSMDQHNIYIFLEGHL